MRLLKKYPFFILTLPLFFIVHGAVENKGQIPLGDGLILWATYILTSAILVGLFYGLFKSLHKAALAVFVLMSFHLFFGALHDWLKQVVIFPILTKYVFILSLFLLLLVAFLWWLKKSKRVDRGIYFLNLLFVFLIVIEGVGFLYNSVYGKSKEEKLHLRQDITDYIKTAKIPDSINKPDIYITILDEYAGKQQLSEGYNYDNSPFINNLLQRGFQVSDGSISNYNATIYSTSSLFSAQFMDSAHVANSAMGFNHSRKLINDNPIISFFENNGYQFYNQSIFRVRDQASPNVEGFVPSKTDVITQATLLSRLRKDVFLNIATRYNIDWYLKKEKYAAGKNNKMAADETLAISNMESSKPKIVYTHLLMPHYPYYNDSTGRELTFSELKKQQFNDKNAYLSYLKYTNKVVLSYLDSLLANTKKQAIIILLSDHGNRYLPNEKEKLLYSNLLSIYTPPTVSFLLADSVSNVNVFPLLLNNMFHFNLPLQSNNIYKFAY